MKAYSGAAFALAFMCSIGPAGAQPVAVRQTEGVLHGFLTLRTLKGTLLARGDLIQVAHGDRVTSELVFHFKDGSLHDEQATFSQRDSFRLISDHLVQKGPAFPHPIDVSIDAARGRVTVRYDDHGATKVQDKRLDLPPTLGNGMILTLLKNVSAEGPIPTVPLLAATPAPRLVTLAIAAQGKDALSIAGATRQATHYVVKVRIGGLAGLLAPLVGKQPPDSHVWILPGKAPAFVKAEQPFYVGGPLWRIELTSPTWAP